MGLQRRGSRKDGCRLSSATVATALSLLLLVVLCFYQFQFYNTIQFSYRIIRSTALYPLLAIYRHEPAYPHSGGGGSGFYSYTLEVPGTQSATGGIEDEDRIPAIIHHFSRTDLIPARWQLSYSSCVGLHKRHRKNSSGSGEGYDYQFILWTDVKIRLFIERRYPHFLKTFDSYPQSIQRVDAGRYFILHHFGGIYIDLDVGCRVSLDQIRRDLSHRESRYDIVLPLTEPFGVSNDFMMAAKNTHFMAYVTHKLISSSDYASYSPFLQVLASTGPLFLSATLFSYSYKDAEEALTIESSGKGNGSSRSSIALLANSDYTEVLLLHKQGGSWHNADGRWISYIFYTVFPVLQTAVSIFILAVIGYMVAYGWVFWFGGNQEISEHKTYADNL